MLFVHFAKNVAFWVNLCEFLVAAVGLGFGIFVLIDGDHRSLCSCCRGIRDKVMLEVTVSLLTLCCLGFVHLAKIVAFVANTCVFW